MEVKLFEIRDAGTFIPAIAIRLRSNTESERYLLSRAGFGTNRSMHTDYILLHRLIGGQMTYDPHGWEGGATTMPYAHQYIIEQWDNLRSGDVVDVEYITGQTTEPKVSERITAP